MAICYFHMDIKKRSKGHSVESVGAYMTGSQMVDARTNEKYDHRVKDDVSDVFVMAPELGVSHFKEPESLCHKISMGEKRKDAQLCRYAVIALPIELQSKENKKLIREFCQQAFVRRGMVVLVAIHGIGSGNPHVHIMITMRTFDPVSGEFGLKKREWNHPDVLLSQRKEWEVVCNQFLEQAGFAQRISCESYEKRGITKPKQKHMGTYVHKLWKEEGIITELSAQYVLDTETKNLEIINKKIEMAESEIAVMKLENDKQLAEVILEKTPDLTEISDVSALQLQSNPTEATTFVIPSHPGVLAGPTFDLSRVYRRRTHPKTIRIFARVRRGNAAEAFCSDDKSWTFTPKTRDGAERTNSTIH